MKIKKINQKHQERQNSTGPETEKNTQPYFKIKIKNKGGGGLALSDKHGIIPLFLSHSKYSRHWRDLKIQIKHSRI